MACRRRSSHCSRGYGAHLGSDTNRHSVLGAWQVGGGLQGNVGEKRGLILGRSTDKAFGPLGPKGVGPVRLPHVPSGRLVSSRVAIEVLADEGRPVACIIHPSCESRVVQMAESWLPTLGSLVSEHAVIVRIEACKY